MSGPIAGSVAEVVALAVMSALALVTVGVKRVFDRRREYREMPPVATIATAAPDTFVRIIGTIVESGTVNASITGRTCACFSAAVYPIQIRRTKEETFRDLGERVSRVGSADFIVDDGSGRIAVDASGLEVRAELDHRSTSKSPTKLHDVTMLPPAPFDELRLDEGVLTIGTRVVLEGIVQRGVAAPDSTVFRAGASSAVLAPSGTRSTSVSNLPAALATAVRHQALARRGK